MFNAEDPIEPWTPGEREEFERHVRARQQTANRAALLALAAFIFVCLAIVPFLAGHLFHKYWKTLKFLLFVAMGLLLWLLLKVGTVYASWQAARETRRETPG